MNTLILISFILFVSLKFKFSQLYASSDPNRKSHCFYLFLEGFSQLFSDYLSLKTEKVSFVS